MHPSPNIYICVCCTYICDRSAYEQSSGEKCNTVWTVDQLLFSFNYLPVICYDKQTFIVCYLNRPNSPRVGGPCYIDLSCIILIATEYHNPSTVLRLSPCSYKASHSVTLLQLLTCCFTQSESCLTGVFIFFKGTGF